MHAFKLIQDQNVTYFLFFQVTNQHGQKSGKSAISESHRLCIFFSDSDSILYNRIQKKKELSNWFPANIFEF